MTDANKPIGVIARHPLIAFFVLAYLFSWLSFFILGGPVLFPFGSIVAAVIVAAASEGSRGLKDLVGRCLFWQVSWIWYLAAIIVPVLLALTAVYLSVAFGRIDSPTFPALGFETLLLLPLAMSDAPLWEDSGWRGFAMPRFPATRSRGTNTAILGLLLAGWHLPLALTGGAIAAPYVITTFLSAFVTNWIYYNSRQSALLAIIYHSAANAAGLALFHGYSDQDLLSLFWSLAAVNLVAVIVVLVIGRKIWFGREPSSKQGTKL
jgi:hypothetical protein